MPGYGVPHENVAFTTRDGVQVAGSYLPGPDAPSSDGGPAVLLVHGFGSHRRKPAYALLAEELSTTVSVLAIDVRGHGRSGGESTLGLAETLEVTAGAAWLRGRGHRWVGVVGVSMGATAVIRAAGTAPVGAYDAVCTISAVSRWGLRDTPAMQQLSKAVTVAAYRRAYRAILGVRIAIRAWPNAEPPDETAHWPVQPVDAVGGIAPTPLLIVHGVDDHYFGPEQAVALRDAASEPVTLWLEPPGFGHAEDGLTVDFARRLTWAVGQVVQSGRWPDGHSMSGPLR